MDERRASERSHIYKMARIDLGKAQRDCLIRNLSDGGARLQFRDAVPVPDRFVLLVTPKKGARPCHVVWHQDRDYGVAFD